MPSYEGDPSNIIPSQATYSDPYVPPKKAVYFPTDGSLPSIATLGFTLQALRLISSPDIAMDRYNPYSQKSALSLGNASNAPSFQRVDIPSRPQRDVAGGWHGEIMDVMHKILRAKSRRAHDTFLAPVNAFYEMLKQTPANTVIPLLELRAALQTFKDKLGNMPIVPASKDGKQLLQLLTQEIASLEAHKQSAAPASLATMWELLLGHQRIHEVWMRLAKEHSILETHLGYSYRDISQAYQAGSAGLMDALSQLHAVPLSLSLPTTQEQEANKTVTVILDNNDKPSIPYQSMILGLFSGKMQLDKDRVPRSLQQVIEKIGNVDKVTQRWRELNAAIERGLRSQGFSPEQAEQVMAHNQLTISRHENEVIQRAVARSLPELEFVVTLEQGRQVEPLYYMDELMSQLRSFAGAEPSPPYAKTPLQLQVLLASIVDCVESIKQDNQEMVTEAKALLAPLRALLPQRPIADLNNAKAVGIPPCYRGQNGQLVNQEMADQLVQAAHNLKGFFEKQKAHYPNATLFHKLLDHNARLLDTLELSASHNHNQDATLARARA